MQAPFSYPRSIVSTKTTLARQLDTGIEAYGIAPYTRILKMDPGEASKIIHEAKEVAKDLSIHTHSM